MDKLNQKEKEKKKETERVEWPKERTQSLKKEKLSVLGSLEAGAGSNVANLLWEGIPHWLDQRFERKRSVGQKLCSFFLKLFRGK